MKKMMKMMKMKRVVAIVLVMILISVSVFGNPITYKATEVVFDEELTEDTWALEGTSDMLFIGLIVIVFVIKSVVSIVLFSALERFFDDKEIEDEKN